MKTRFLKTTLGILMTLLLMTTFMPTASAIIIYAIKKADNAPLYNALHDGYGLGDGTGITQTALAACTGEPGSNGATLMLDADNITNVEGLQYCTKIVDLRIDSSNLNNIDPLANAHMSNIQYLDLYQDQFTSLPALNMPNLKYLALFNNYDLTTSGISSALTGCGNLQYLMLDGTQIHNFAFLKNATALKCLSASRTGITVADIDSLSNVSSQLTTLEIEQSALDSSSLQKICGFFPNLQYLYASSCNIEDISALTGLPLKSLTLKNNFVHDLSPISALSNCTIDLSYNPLYMTTGSPNFNAVQALKSNSCTVDTTNPYLFKVTFSCNSSMGTAGSSSVLGHYYGQTIQIPGVTAANPVALTFTGWDKAGSGTTLPRATTTSLTAQLPLSSSNYDASSNTYTVTYTALFAPTQYTVTFDSQGGSVVADKTTTYNTTITAPTPPTRAGYQFDGWYKDAAYANAWSFYSDKVTGDITLIAKWTQIFSVTYNGNGATGGSVPADTNGYLNGASATVLGNTGNLVRTGFTFAGWNTKADGTGTSYSAGNTFAMPSDNVTLYATWTLNPNTSIVKFNSQGGSIVADKTAQNNTVITAPTPPTKKGYTFAGWYKEAACKNAWVFSTNKVTSNITLYANWKINKYTVTFNSEGGSKVKSISTNYNTAIKQPTKPKKTGYTFGGWYKEAGCKNVWSFASDKVAGNTILYAKWNALTYTVTFNSKGGSAIAATKAHYNSLIAAPAPPAKKGYKFVGWYKDSACKHAWKFTSDRVKANTKLYAKWKSK